MSKNSVSTPFVGRPEPDEVVVVEPITPVEPDAEPITDVKATPQGDLPDPERMPVFTNQDVIDLITHLMSPIANEHLIERAKAIQTFLKGE